MTQQLLDYLDLHNARFVEELKQFLRIPSVSADSRFKPDVHKAAQFVHQHLQSAGCMSEIVETQGHPIVFAEYVASPAAPTVLIYGHYDVQPADPLDQWITPAFEPDIRDGCIWARGATDDKGQVFTHIKALEAWTKTAGAPPVNVKFVIEGEEEVGSDNLDRFFDEYRARCKCDVAVISDTAQYGPGMPAITYGLRGIMACEITLTGPKQDLHSGVFGGSIANPVNALASLIGSLHDGAGRVTIPDFYKDVIPLTDAERRAFADLPFEESQYLKNLGVGAAHGEAGFTTTERRWARPTCDVNGIYGGYQGEGPKTIIPSKASAKITCRLVPDQDPVKLLAAMKTHLEQRLPPGITMKFNVWHSCGGIVCDLNSPFMAAARTAIQKGFGTQAVMIREGGSIPVVATLKDKLGVDTLLLGWGQNTDNLHSPNEHFSLDSFAKGTRTSALLLQELAARK